MPHPEFTQILCIPKSLLGKGLPGSWNALDPTGYGYELLPPRFPKPADFVSKKKAVTIFGMVKITPSTFCQKGCLQHVKSHDPLKGANVRE